jgi:hypothetical protein
MIDTLKIARRLEEAELSKVQAEAIASSLAELTAADLATKEDIANVRTAIAELKGELQRFVIVSFILVAIAQTLVLKLWH